MPLLTAAPAAAGGPVYLYIQRADATPDPQRAGGVVTYSFDLRGNPAAEIWSLDHVQLHVFLPPYVTPVDSNYEFSVLPDGRVVLDFGSYWEGQPFIANEVEIEVLVNDDAAALNGGPFDLIATAWLMAGPETFNMGVGTDNQAIITTRITERADVEVTKVRVPDLLPNYIIAGQTILYEVTVTNKGPSAARDVVLYDWTVENDATQDLELIDSSVACNTLVMAAGKGWFQPTPVPANSGDEDVYACKLGTVRAGEERILQFLYRVPSGMSAIVTNDIVNWALVMSTSLLVPKVGGDFATPDPNWPPAAPAPWADNDYDNLAAARDTNVWAEADISVTKESSPNPVVAGE
jgi:hypothetical protein